MEMTVAGRLFLSYEEVNIEVSGEAQPYTVGPAKAYNKAKETIIKAEEERQAKIGSKKEES